LNELASKPPLRKLPLFSRLPVRLKVKGWGALKTIRRVVARALRALPGSWKALGLPSRKIRSLKNWIAQQRAGLDWCEKCKGPFYEMLFETAAITRRRPHTFDGKMLHHEFSWERYHIHNEAYVARIPRGRVLGPDGTVITPDGQIVEESVWGNGWLERDRSLTALHLVQPELISGSCFTVATAFSEGFAHWMLDALPRFYALDRLPADEVQILVGRPLSSWQRESLELIGIDLSRVNVLGERYIESEVLYFPSFVGDPGNEHPGGMRWLREKLLGDFVPARHDRRLYISRRLAARRRILNEADLEPILQDFGFEIIEAEQMPLREQIELFAQAEAVVSLHGAGLSNILFARSGCKVFEIFEPDHVKVMYWALADVLRHDYWYHIGQTVGERRVRHEVTGHDDIYVPVQEFARSLAAMMNHRNQEPKGNSG
jgi:hypothetical protein